jgi:trimeric autotransporter adhesin
MAIIPSNTQFRGDTTGVPIVERGSAQTQGRAEYFTMQDIVDTIPGGLSGSGTAGKTAKFTAGTTLGDGLLNDNGTSIWYNGTTSNATTLSYGYGAMFSGGGNYNTAIGYASQRNSLTGLYNTSLGFNTLTNLVSGNGNVAIGEFALQDVNGGHQNVCIGYTAGWKIQTGTNNTAVGRTSLQNNITGNENTALGVSSLLNTTSAFNTGIGSQALVANTTGEGNSALGQLTNSGNFSHSVILGREATATASNQFVVGSASYNSGAVTTASAAQTKTWDVIINGVAQKILLA